jgi:3-oxoadipate enol-lactonase
MTPDFIELWRTRAAHARADGMGPLVDETVRRWFSPGFALDHPREMERVRAMVRATSVVGYVGHALAFTTIDLGARLPELHAPTLFVSGGGDPGGGRSDIMQSMADAAPNARHVAIEGAGHICNIEASDAFNALVGAFLATDQPLHSPGGRGEASPDG